MSPTLRNALKLGISVTLVLYLVSSLRANDPETFERLGREPLNWPRLAVAWSLLVIEMAAVGIRWWTGLAAAGLRHPLGEVVRLSLLGYALNFVGLGIVGGDVIKALLLRTSQRLRVMISVVVDRLIGLECVLLFAGGATLLIGFEQFSPAFRVWLRGLFVLAAAGLVIGPVVLLSGRGLRALPLPGGIGGRLASVDEVVRMYRRRWVLLLASAGVSMSILCTQIVAFYLISTSLPGPSPALVEQAVIVPLAILTSVIPAPASGLGVFDLAMSFLYPVVTGGRIAGAQGLLAMMLSRMLSATMASAGLWIYLRRRDAVSRALQSYES